MNVQVENHWSLGTLIGGPVLITLILAFYVCGQILWTYRHSDKISLYDRPYLKGVAIGCWVISVLILVSTLSGFYPYKTEYHKFIAHYGPVAQIADRQIASGNGMETKYVVTFENDNQQYGCSDTRCALVKPGDVLSLSCIKDWEWAATDGYNCRFVEWTPQTSS